MAVDSVTPLASATEFTEGPFADLVKNFSPIALQNLMREATRACESACDRRLAPFTDVLETQRADAMDIEDALDAYSPMDPAAAMGYSRAQSLGANQLVRHFWVREFPARYPELWTGTVTSIEVLWSFAGTTPVTVSGVQFEADTGHVRFNLGSFVPPGSTIKCRYSGGYQTSPSDLVSACKFTAAGMAIRQLDPARQQAGHDPDALRAEAMEMLAPYVRG